MAQGGLFLLEVFRSEIFPSSCLKIEIKTGAEGIRSSDGSYSCNVARESDNVRVEEISGLECTSCAI